MYSHYLDTFICVADCGSFSKAGEAMFISATAVMKQINQLESALECPLFVRTSHGLILTEAGKSYYHNSNCWNQESVVLHLSWKGYYGKYGTGREGCPGRPDQLPSPYQAYHTG